MEKCLEYKQLESWTSCSQSQHFSLGNDPYKDEDVLKFALQRNSFNVGTSLITNFCEIYFLNAKRRFI